VLLSHQPGVRFKSHCSAHWSCHVYSYTATLQGMWAAAEQRVTPHQSWRTMGAHLQDVWPALERIQGGQRVPTRYIAGMHTHAYTYVGDQL